MDPEKKKKKSSKKKSKLTSKATAYKSDRQPKDKKQRKMKEQKSVQKEEEGHDDTKEETKSDVPATFKSLGLSDALCESTAALGWKVPSDIQREAIPYGLQGRDVIGLAETGSGKTGAFGLPMLQKLLDAPQPYFGLCLAPTRELAFQIAEQLDALGSSFGLKVVTVVGGVDMMDQAIALARKPHIIVASPGRIVDHLENTKGFNLRKLKFLVLDEADRLLDMDFEKEINQILAEIPSERTTYLFSATMTSKVAKLQRASLQAPVKVEVSKKYQTAKGLIAQYTFIPAIHKDCYLAYILNELSGNSMIIFTSTCDHTNRVAIMLRNLGFSAVPLHGKMTQPQRLGSLNKFKSGQRSILIATDVASRGLDIPHVDCVINYDIPTNSKDYIHRVGRTARAGRSGRAITVVTQYDVELLQRIEECKLLRYFVIFWLSSHGVCYNVMLKRLEQI